jgi:hypothetical protein
MRRCGVAALVRVMNPDCECKSGAAPEHISKGMYPRGALRSMLTVFFFLVSACKKQVRLTQDVVAIPVTPDVIRTARDWEGNLFGAPALGEKKGGEGR